jgi:hypothetical protein
MPTTSLQHGLQLINSLSNWKTIHHQKYCLTDK